ncbi:MAG TPA: serine/threonine-protein kinase [Polyangiaceae bacterium]
MNAAAKPPTLPGSRMLGTLDGKYELLRELGSGAAGTVYEAEHVIVGKRVAVKVLHPLIARDETVRARFVGEARAAAQIGHENVIDIFDFGVSPEGAPYLVMDLLDGETLEELISRRGALPPATACEFMVQILAGLGTAHAMGIVHRDLKPSNVVITYPRPDSPVVKILDFGIATGVRGGVQQKNEGLIGTPQYMSPEQAQAMPVDERADLYAAGVIFYEMLSGEAPFTGNAAEVLRAVITGKWRPLQSLNPAVPRALIATVVAAMATHANDRIQSAHAFAQKLAPFLSHPPPFSVPHGPRSADAFLLQAGSYVSEGPLLSDVPGMSRPPRDFPSFDLAKIAGKPRGEPMSDELLQSPIIPKAPGAARIKLFTGSRDLERWSDPAPMLVGDSYAPQESSPTPTPAPEVTEVR